MIIIIIHDWEKIIPTGTPKNRQQRTTQFLSTNNTQQFPDGQSVFEFDQIGNNMFSIKVYYAKKPSL